jgi:branched-subunit amino acid ABC-type transport system permease component
MVDIGTLLQILWTGLATATYGVLLAAAFSLVLKVVKVWNFAQAGLMGIAYYAMYVAIHKLGWPAAAGVVLSLAVTIAAALAMEVYGLRTFRRRKSPALTYFIFTLVVSEFMQYLLAMIFGTEPVSLAATLMSKSTMVGGIVISRWDVTALCVAAVTMAALYVLLKRTRQGQFMVAVADNPQLSRLYGIDVARVYALTFVVASILIVAAMYLFGTRASMVPNTPLEMMLFAVIAALLGGMGNVFGAAGAALFLALLRSFSILVIPSAWQGLILYALLFVTILFFPNGVKLRRPRIGIKPAAKAAPSAA